MAILCRLVFCKSSTCLDVTNTSVRSSYGTPTTTKQHLDQASQAYNASQTPVRPLRDKLTPLLILRYFSSPQSDSGALPLQSLGRIFDEYRGIVCPILQYIPILISSLDNIKDSPNGIGIEGAMKFFADINVQLDEVTCLGIMELCKCPAMGEFTREGFVDGWRGVQ